MNLINLLFSLGIILLICAMALLIIHPNQGTPYESLESIIGGVGLFVSGFITSPKIIDRSKLKCSK